MAKADDNIPTLTQIVELGDESMRDHFDAHELAHNASTKGTTVENASAYENKQDVTDLPSIQAEAATLQPLPDEDFSEAMQDRLEQIQVEAPGVKASSSHEIRKAIDEAIEQALPGIANQLKDRLYKQFNVK